MGFGIFASCVDKNNTTLFITRVPVVERLNRLRWGVARAHLWSGLNFTCVFFLPCCRTQTFWTKKLNHGQMTCSPWGTLASDLSTFRYSEFRFKSVNHPLFFSFLGKRGTATKKASSGSCRLSCPLLCSGSKHSTGCTNASRARTFLKRTCAGPAGPSWVRSCA
jgi:hypothetical protein